MKCIRAALAASSSANSPFSAALMGAALVSSALFSTAARADPLSFDDAIARARSTAPSVRATELGTDAARAAQGAAGARPDPKLSVGIDSFPISGPLAFKPSRDNFTWLRVGISQDIPNPAKRRAQRVRANADVALADASTVLEERTVEIATGVAWITLAYAQKRLGVVDAVRGKLERLVRTTAAAVASGDARPSQTLAGRQALAKLDDQRDELVAAVGRARADLTRWTGDNEPGPVA